MVPFGRSKRRRQFGGSCSPFQDEVENGETGVVGQGPQTDSALVEIERLGQRRSQEPRAPPLSSTDTVGHSRMFGISRPFVNGGK